MQAKFKVGDVVKIRPEICSNTLKKFADRVTTITDVRLYKVNLKGNKEYRYRLSVDDDPRNLWHPLYFELIPPTPKHRRIRL